MLIELVQKLVGIFLLEVVVEPLLVFWINQALILFPHRPLFLWRELLHSWKAPRLCCVVFCNVLVVSQLHLEVESTLIGLSLISSLENQVMESRTISSIVKIDNSWGICTLSGLSSLKHLAEQ